MTATAACSSDIDGVGPDGIGTTSKIARISSNPSRNGVAKRPEIAPAIAA
jgi:hypothetical protein